MILSAVVITKDEENNIRDCLNTLSFCDEIVVVDDYSHDNTIKIAKKFGAQIFQRRLNSDFAAQRNFGLKRAKGDWVLFVDADERVSKDLAREIVQVINDPTLNYAGYYLKRVDYMWGRQLRHGEIGAVRLHRLGRSNAGVWKRRVHEEWSFAGRTYLLKNPLLHYSHPTLSEFINHVNNFSTLHAKANLEEGKGSSLAKVIIWPTGKFVYNYIARGGFLDGLAGFIFSVIMSFNSFLAWNKLWFYQKNTQ